jgi:hypothetical protein
MPAIVIILEAIKLDKLTTPSKNLESQIGIDRTRIERTLKG